MRYSGLSSGAYSVGAYAWQQLLKREASVPYLSRQELIWCLQDPRLDPSPPTARGFLRVGPSIGAKAMDFRTFLDPSLAQLCKTSALQASAEDTVSSQRSHQTGRQVAQINYCPPAGTGCSSHSSFRNDSATTRPPGAPPTWTSRLGYQLADIQASLSHGHGCGP